MHYKNTSGQKVTTNLGRFSSEQKTIANNATAEFQDENPSSIGGPLDNLIEAQRLESLGKGEVASLPKFLRLLQPTLRRGYVVVDLNTVVDGNILTIAGVNFEIDGNSTVTGSNISVTLGANTAAAAAALKTAINAHATVKLIIKATDIIQISTSNVKLVLEAISDTLIGDIAISKTGAPITLATAVAAAIPAPLVQDHLQVTATGTDLLIKTGLKTITALNLTVFTSAGVQKLYDGKAAVVNGGSIYLDASGSVDLANTDVVWVSAWGTPNLETL